MDTTGVIESSPTAEVTGKEGSEGSQDPGTVTPQRSQGQEDNAGGSQEQPEDGEDQGTDTRRPQFRSKQRTISELRTKLRERDSQIRSFEERLSKFEQQVSPRGQDPKPQRNFFEAPNEILEEKLSAFEQRLLDKIQQTETQKQAAYEWEQEKSEAIKFIQGQRGYTKDLERELAEIIESEPSLEGLRPMDKVRFAHMLWKEQKGITDKSAIKSRASTVVGAPPSTGGGPRVWTEGEIDSELAKFPKDFSKWTKEESQRFDRLQNELKLASREGRVKK
jgi:hypothetical protein